MKELAAQAFTVLFGKGLIRVSQFVAFILIARFLTPSEFGWFGIVATSVTLAATLGSLGLRQSIAYNIGRGIITAREATLTTLLLWPLLGGVSALIVWLLLAPDAPDADVNGLAFVVCISVAAAILIMLLQGVPLGQGRIRAFTTTDTTPKTALMVIAAILAVTGLMTLMSALWAQALGYLIAVPSALWFALREGGQIRTRFRLLPSMLRYGIVFAMNLFLITLCTRISMFFIQASVGDAAAGQFYAASRVNEIFLEAATALGMVLFSNAARTDNKKKTIAASARLSAWLFWFFFALAIVLYFAAPIVVQVLLGSDYRGAAPALQLLAFGLAPAAASKIIYPTIAGTGSPLFGTPVIAMSVTITTALAYFLVQPLGVTGGALAVVIGQLLLYVGYATTAAWKYGVPWTDFFLFRRTDIQASWKAVARTLMKRRSDDN
ncbi:oligosaccharide flippase family protein [Microbacterium sp. RG1]|uniref:oligosaccharide flippase family protein n=1 Tax=Microbacterium sp. RG1 TaxID=2489212 RepID=UPI0010CA2214|nr:oligosaccharide flippase family protein [Microbacterium sp. RG1]QCQ17987.1 hypothetical protein EHF32_15365 [Microbacterium sp. RG1]